MKRTVSRIGLWVLIALALPRIIRILYPYLWVEEDALVAILYSMSAGLRPYLDFSHAQMPLLEWIGAVYVALVGASHRSLELLNGAAIYGTSLLLLLLGRRAVGYAAAVTAALLYSCSSLVFRYHVWSREYFVTVLVLSAALLILDDEMRPTRQVVGVSALLTAACGIKLTAVVSVMALTVFVWLIQRRPTRAVVVATSTAVGLLLFVAFCYWTYGSDFLFQAFLFHLLKGRDYEGGGITYVAQIIDVLGPLSVLGLVSVAVRRSGNPALALTLMMIAAAGAFFGVVSPTSWGHNYLEVWPFVAILAGAGAVWLGTAVRAARLSAAAAVIFVVVSLTWITPVVNENSLRGSFYGFGFVARAELATLADGLRAASGRHDEVVAPPFIAFEANRLLRVRFPENYGVMHAAEAAYRSDGFAAARERFGRSDFFALINQTSSYWIDVLNAGIVIDGPVNAVIPDSDLQLLPLINVSPSALEALGFSPHLTTPHFVLLTRPAASGR